ncbi:translation initiation factor IF-2-like [Penaeus japonicus]|uniref:translation initiation factor IF-2-like n=1 Tax=Penaeus japonicus TaxID=27405 RepID=UPI001C7147C3|nr:translation initiation factor IF-2-like [Penaeus japonicus]
MKFVLLLLAVIGLARARPSLSAEYFGRDLGVGSLYQDDDNDDTKPGDGDPVLSILGHALGDAAFAPARDVLTQPASRPAQRARGSGSDRSVAPATDPARQPKTQKKIKPVPALASSPDLVQEGLLSPLQPSSALSQLKVVPLPDTNPLRMAARAPPTPVVHQRVAPVPAVHQKVPVPALASQPYLHPHLEPSRAPQPPREVNVDFDLDFDDVAPQSQLEANDAVGVALKPQLDTNPVRVVAPIPLPRPQMGAAPVAGKALPSELQPQLKRAPAPEVGLAPRRDPSSLAAELDVASVPALRTQSRASAEVPSLRRPRVWDNYSPSENDDNDDDDDKSLDLAVIMASPVAPRTLSKPMKLRAQSPASLYRSLALMNRLSSRLLQRSSDTSSEE